MCVCVCVCVGDWVCVGMVCVVCVWGWVGGWVGGWVWCVYMCIYLYFSSDLNAQLKELITVLILSYFCIM